MWEEIAIERLANSNERVWERYANGEGIATIEKEERWTDAEDDALCLLAEAHPNLLDIKAFPFLVLDPLALVDDGCGNYIKPMTPEEEEAVYLLLDSHPKSLVYKYRIGF